MMAMIANQGVNPRLCVQGGQAYRLAYMGEERKSVQKKRIQAVSRVFEDGSLVELIYIQETNTTAFAFYKTGTIAIKESIDAGNGIFLLPVPASNNLIRHRALLLPGPPAPSGSVPGLIADIERYLDRYVDLSSAYRKIASYYVLLTWVYDAFNELPYLRLRGDFGSGKTRALTIIGSICYKAFFASGASTVSPIFHILDAFGGTLVLDEADFRFSDEKSELAKVFNNGNVKGFPVLRTMVSNKNEFDPRAFNVFGPKIVAMRQSFDDMALESRFLTEEMGQRTLRRDIPINLPDIQKDEALSLRNRLLTYRFEKLKTIKIDEALVDPTLSPRSNQILVPLLSIVDDEPLREEIRNAVRSIDQALSSERSTSPEAGVLDILLEAFSDKARIVIPISEITTTFIERHGSDYDRPITHRYMGGIIRKRLRLVTYKSHGVYVVPVTERSKVDELCVRYGVTDRSADASG